MHPKLQTTTTRRLRSRSGEETSEFWIENAQNALKNKLNQPFINSKLRKCGRIKTILQIYSKSEKRYIVLG